MTQFWEQEECRQCDQLEKEIEVRDEHVKALEAELAEANKKATQRGARMQLMWEWMDKTLDLHPPYRAIKAYFVIDRYESASWFNDDGTPK